MEGEKSVDEIISELYNDKAGFGSLKDTWNDVKRKHKDIKYKDVKAWYQRNVDYNVIQRGENSFVANAPHEEYQLDVFFMNIKADDEYKIGVAAIDVFTKYATAVALSDKKPETLLEALKRVLTKLGAKPKILMSDEEGSLQSKLVMDYLKKEKIKYIINRNHCPFVERFIRTLRNLITRRLQKRPDERWYGLLFEVLSTYNYKMVNRITKLKPAEAQKPENLIDVKMNMEEHAKHEKDYGEINVGDRVRVFRKRKRVGEKESVPKWSRNTFEVLRIEKDPVAGNLFYISTFGEKPFLRGQLLKP
jgi:hypothetical protein